MNKLIISFFSLLLLFSCTGNRQEDRVAGIKGTSRQDSLVPPRLTILAQLPDSLLPKAAVLSDLPAPVRVSAKTPTVKMVGGGGVANFARFTTDNGLALDAVSNSLVDRMGNLWFATLGGGVSRYDGKSFTNFTTTQGLANNTVWSIAEDRKGNLWFGTNGGGVSRYDGRSFVTFTTGNGLAGNAVYSIAEDKTGKLWFGTLGAGVSRYDPLLAQNGAKAFTTFTTTDGLSDSVVYSIAEDKSGNLWFGTESGGVCSYDGKAFTTYTTVQGLANNKVWSIARDKAGNLWFGTDSGLSRYDPLSLPVAGAKLFTNFTTTQGLGSNVVKSMTVDKTGMLWLGTDGGGVSCYDPASAPGAEIKPFTTFSTDHGLANNKVYSITEDNMGNLWLGTNGGGLSRYDGRSFTSFSTAQGLANNQVFCIAEDRSGDLWFGTYGGGVSRYDGKSFSTLSTGHGLPNKFVYSITEDKKGDLWFGTNGGGVSRYDGKSFTTYTTAQRLGSNVVYSIAADKAGSLWFGTNLGGVSRYDGTSFTTFTTDQGLAHNTVLSIILDKSGNLWFGTSGGGVSRYDGKSFISFTTAQGLADNVVYSIAEDKAGNLWFGTQEGLSVMGRDAAVKLASYTGSGAACEKFFKTFTTADGLPDNLVTQVLQMPDGKMAVGTNLGITMFIPSVDLLTLGGLEIYNSLTFFPVKDINGGQNCMLLDRKGVIWAGTGNEKTALVRFDPAALYTNNHPPTVVIKNIEVNESRICWYDLQNAGGKSESNATPPYITEEALTLGKVLSEAERDSMRKHYSGIRFDGITRSYPIPEHLVLPYNQNNITIDFAAIETGKPNLVNYRYILEGYEKEWSPTERKTSATFGNINEGTYTFKVMAQVPNGVWSAPVLYRFKVLPPWYRTWWAYVSYILLFILAMRGYIKWRERVLRNEREKLKTKVKERTAVIEKQKEELEQKHIVITKLVDEQEHTIEQRTGELAESNIKLANVNNKLVHLIQYNAHNLREPLTRISGGMLIKEYMTDDEFFTEVWPHLQKAVNDLDVRLKDVIKIADETVGFYDNRTKHKDQSDSGERK